MTFLATYPNPATLWCEDMLLTLGVKESDCIERGEALCICTCEKTCNLHNLSCDWLLSVPCNLHILVKKLATCTTWVVTDFSAERIEMSAHNIWGAAASIIWSYGARQKYITFKLEKCSRIYFGFGQWWRIYLNKNFIKK